MFHHKEDGDEQVPKTVDVSGVGNAQSVEYEKVLNEEKHHKHMEELGGLGTVGTISFALVLTCLFLFSLICVDHR